MGVLDGVTEGPVLGVVGLGEAGGGLVAAVPPDAEPPGETVREGAAGEDVGDDVTPGVARARDPSWFIWGAGWCGAEPPKTARIVVPPALLLETG